MAREKTQSLEAVSRLIKKSHRAPEFSGYSEITSFTVSCFGLQIKQTVPVFRRKA